MTLLASFVLRDGLCHEELLKLLAIEEGDSEESDTEEEIRDAFLERGLHPTDPQVRATAQLHAWLDGDGVRSAIFLGGVAVGKSSCIDAMHQAFDNWELLRFSAASLALCAADTQLSTDMPRLGPPEREAGLFESL